MIKPYYLVKDVVEGESYCRMEKTMTMKKQIIENAYTNTLTIILEYILE